MGNDKVYKAGASGADVASRSDKYLDGQGRVHGEIAYGKDYVMDFVLTKFDNLGRLWEQSRPYRSGTPPMYAYEYDTLDRTTKVTAPDGSIVERFYNESSYPSAATPSAMGQTIRAKDAWGRERWARFDEQNRLVEVVEPDPNGNGAVATGGMKTSYGYDTLGNLTLVTQGDQTRSFQYDALSRLTHQKLAERDATLNSSGAYVGAGQWSDVFNYDNRSNLTWRVEARGVKTLFNYNNDPLNRLQSVQYDTSGVPSGLIGSIPTAPDVTYAYLTTGDKSRLQSVTMSDGMGNESFSYDSEGRLSQASQTFPGRTSYPLVTDYLWDSLDRSQELNYPAQWGVSGNPRKKVEPLYDIASRVDTLKYDATNYASGFVYNAASQVESLNVGSQITESYTFDGSTGLLFEQEVKKGATTHLKLKYNYTLTNSGTNSGAKTGQLTGITDVQTASRSKAYVYDKLGRLKEAKGGSDAFSNPSWTQTYSYDRYGNRTGVSKSGSGAGSIPLDGLASLVYTNAQSQTVNNRITTSGYEYDPAGNQTRGQVEGGTWRRYKYDAAGRLAVVLDESSNPLETYSYGASNERLVTVQGSTTSYYCWEGGQVIAEYHAGTSSNLVWDKNYIHLGGRLLATTDSGGTKYHHPDRLGTRLVTDASGDPSTEQAHLPFGTALGAESTGTPTNRRFTSYDRSANTGMDYAVNRFYNSAQGRFNQVDPIGVGATSLSDPQSLNLYSYCGNDPVNRLDPDGLFWGKLFGWVGKAFKFLFKVAAIALFVVAIVLLPTMIAAGGFWLSSGAWFGWGSWAGLMGAAGVAGLAGWHNGKLGEIAGAFLTTFGKGRNFRTPPISSGAGGISRFLQSKEELQKKAQEEALKRTGRAISRRIARKVFRIADIIWDLMYPDPVGGDLTIQDIVNYPDRILWKIPGKEVKTPAEVEASLGQIPDGWKVEAMRHSQSNPGGGWILREYNSAGNLTGRMIQWHPGGGHHGPHPYWKVSTGRGTIRIGPQF